MMARGPDYRENDAMCEIEHLSGRHLSGERNLERIVAAARADPGFSLMVKEREMEWRAIRASYSFV